MMYIICQTANEELQAVWHVGEAVPTIRGREMQKAAQDVTMVQADGDELTFVLEEMQNLPRMTRRPVQRWYGTDAQFIAGNLFARGPGRR
jgi:hypothetical protein